MMEKGSTSPQDKNKKNELDIDEDTLSISNVDDDDMNESSESD